MSKLFKNTKSLLAVFMAFAVVAVSLFTGVAVNVQAECVGDVSDFHVVGENKEVSLLDPTQPNSESNPYIIETAGQMYCLMLVNCTNGGVTIDTEGAYFKVADGVKAFYMNGGATVAEMTTVDQVKEYFTVTNTGYKKVWTSTGRYFKGHFDGNGVTIYGIGSDGGRAGLFPEVSGNVTVKNVTVKNSYLTASDTAGGIIGNGNNGLLQSVTLENCAVVNNYISAGRGDSGAGGLVGFLFNGQLGASAPLTVNNCLVAGNEIVSTKGQTCTAIGGSFNANGNTFNNSIFLGIAPFDAGAWHTKKTEAYNNCYTDQDLTAADMSYTAAQLVKVDVTTGAGVVDAMPNLDWNQDWFANAGLPELRALHNIAATDNGDGTHSEACACGIAGAAVEHAYKSGTCVCGALEPVADPSISEYTGEEKELSLLDPSQPNSESNPYIIANANQMYNFMVGNSTSGGVAIDTTGKYFKVADGIKAFYMNGGATVAAMTTPEQIKEYFEVTNTGYKKVWSDPSRAFKGNFDGNGVTIYGIGGDGGNAGLFPYVAGDVTIKNVTVKNSYIAGSAAGGLVGNANVSIAANSITAENCAVINNYIAGGRGDAGGGGLFGFLYNGNSTDGYPELHVNNCIVHSNAIIATNAAAPGGFALAGSMGGNRSHKIANSIFLGGDGLFNTGSWWAKQPQFYQNVYTDADLTAAATTYADNQIKIVESVTGAAGKEAMPGLDWNSAWLANAGMPELRVFHNLTATDNGDGTHSAETCECGLTGIGAAAHTIGADGACIYCDYTDPCASGHTLTSYDAVDPTATTDGNKAYSYCSKCEQYFIDGEVVTREDTVIPAYGTYDSWEPAYPIVGGVSKDDWYDENLTLLDPSQPNSESNPYIIYTAEQLAAVVNAMTAHSGNNAALDTAGKYYKVADGIKAFYMVNESLVDDLDGLNSAEEVKAFFDKNGTANTRRWWEGNTFKGYFDGNGVTVYGIYGSSGQSALFNKVSGNVTVKNVKVAKCYFSGAAVDGGVTSSAAGIIAETANDNATITIDNCAVVDNYISSSHVEVGVGVFVARAYGCVVNVSNSLAEGNLIKNSANASTGLIAYGWGVPSYNNVIAIGVTPFRSNCDTYSNSWHHYKADVFSNVYTDQDLNLSKWVYDEAYNGSYTDEQIKQLTVEEMKGAAGKDAMPGLDWANAWLANDSIPELRVFHDIVTTDNGDGTHTESCKDCDITNTTAHTAGDAVEENRVGGDCTTDGSYDSVTYCTVCDAEISRETIYVTAPGHTEGEAVEENRVDATCDTAGSYDVVVYCSVCGEEISRETKAIEALGHKYVKTEIGGGISEATISFADKANRTEFSSTKQVWEQNGIKLINNKASSTSNVGDYANPLRLYAKSEVIIEFAGMTKIEMVCASASYANVWKDSISDSNATVVVSGSNVTITFTNAVDSFTVSSISAQTRVNSMTVYADGGEIQEMLVCENCGDTREVPKYGDANGDGEINNRDLAVLMQYINGWDVEVDTVTADVNLDGNVNNKDYALIMRSINGWDVQLGL